MNGTYFKRGAWLVVAALIVIVPAPAALAYESGGSVELLTTRDTAKAGHETTFRLADDNFQFVLGGQRTRAQNSRARRTAWLQALRLSKPHGKYDL